MAEPPRLVLETAIYAEDLAAAEAFYGGLLVWRFDIFDDLDYWAISTGARVRSRRTAPGRAPTEA